MLSLNDYLIRIFITHVFTQLELPSGRILLDLGCGNQPYKAIYNRYVKQVVSVDIEQRDAPLTLISDSQFLPFSNNSFDIILFSEVIEHIPDYKLALNEISRVLSPGGYLIITWPFNYSMHELPYDYLRITEFGMQMALEQNGMQISQLFRRGNKITLLHCLTGRLLTNMNEFFRRTPFLGKLFDPLLKLFDKLIEYTYFIGAKRITNNSFFYPDAVGKKLTGVKGSLSLWTLGYCALVKKNE